MSRSSPPGATTDGNSRSVVLLGASNVVIGFPLIVPLLRAGLPGPVRLYAAIGHGRSFGLWSRIFHRSLPGIVQCDLWDALRRDWRPDERPLALLTDIGNDLMYGAPVPEIAGWVETCLQRLARHNADVVLTMLPMASARRLTAAHYTCARTVLFPRCRITWPDMQGRIADLDARVQALAVRYGAQSIEPPGEWYGLDPIHVRRAHRPAAWRQIFSHWPGFDAPPSPPNLPLATRYRLPLLRPALRRVLGRNQETPQPVLHWEQVSVSLY